MVSALSMANMMWRAQSIMHWKNNPIVPVGLLSIAGSLVLWQHYANPYSPHEHDPLKTFLVMIMVQMLPLVALEVKIMSCADPVGLFCKFAVPVTLTHLIFLTLRVCIYDNYDQLHQLLTGLGIATALYTMFEGFLWSPKAIFHHKSVYGLVFAAALAGFFTVWSGQYLRGLTGMSGVAAEVLEWSISYLEIMAFVPAVWMVFCEDRTARGCQIEELDSKRTSTAFFLFLVMFYLSEDLLNAVEAYQVSVLASAAHVVHFCLLLDFACYILAHIYNPEKLVGEMRKWLPIDLNYEV